MIYVKASDDLFNSIQEYPLTASLAEAKLAVIEMPGNMHILEQLNDIPVIITLTGMVNLEEWRIIKDHIANPQDIPAMVKNYLESLNENADENANENEYEITFDDPPEPEHIVQPTKEEHVQFFEQQHHMNKHQETQPPKQSQQYDLFNQQTSNKGAIAAFFSAVGGVGKTFSSINVAGAAVLSGIETVAIDMDFGYGDIDTATGLVGSKQRERVIDKKATVPKAGWATVPEWRRYARSLKTNLLRHNSGLYVMPCYPYAGSGEIPSTEIEDLILTLAEQFEMVAIDLGVDAFSPHASTALRLADTVFLIGGQDEKTIGKLTQFLNGDYAQKEKTKLVINMVQPTGYYSPKEIAKKLGFAEFDEIPLDKQSVNAAQKKKMLTVQLSGSAAGEAVKGIAGKHLPFGLEQTQNRPAAKKSLFSKILRRG